jgi:hypothetical protein
MSAKHKFGMKMRLVLPIIAEKKSFIAYYIWGHPANYNEIVEFIVSQEPQVWVRVGDKKVLFQLLDDNFFVDLEDGTYDLKMKLAVEDPEDNHYLTADEVLDLIRKDPKWELEEIPK